MPWLIIIILALHSKISGGQVSKSFIFEFENKLENILKHEKLDICFQCHNHLVRYIKDLKSGEPWAMQMFDASVKGLPSGIINGNVYDFGSFEQCLNVHEKKDNETFGKYCLGKTFIQIPVQNTNATDIAFRKFDVSVGRCIPDSCSASDMNKVYAKVDEIMDFSEEYCQTKAMQPKLDAAGIATICVYGIIIAIVILSTTYDVVCQCSKKKSNPKDLIAFSIFTNFRNLINVTNVPGEITCLNGIRIISLLWIVLTHKTMAKIVLTADNFNNFAKSAFTGTNMYIPSTYLSVDTFFYMSGLLISYNYIINMKRGVQFNLVSFYVQRYLRLTPALAVLVLFSITLLKHVGSGPLWPVYMNREMIDICERDWWKALLYIQNVYKSDRVLCINPTWYLSTEMQLYIISPLLLFLLKKSRKMFLLMISLLTVCSSISCALVIWYFEITPFNFNIDGAEKFNAFHFYYLYPFYTRACTWLIGLLMGYVIFLSKDKNFQLLDSKVFVVMAWLISITVMGTCIFAGSEVFTEEFNKIMSLLHGAFVRPAWAIAISWVIFACVTGHGGPVDWFLSLPFFKVLSRLSYVMFLTHLLVVSVVIFNMKTSTPIIFSQLVFEVWGDYAYSLATGLVLSLSIEIPINNLIRSFMKKTKK